jgi:hypothetical protein
MKCERNPIIGNLDEDAMTTGGLDFDTFMKALVKIPRTKIETRISSISVN